ncbi:MAG: hypothetical protein SCH66_05275 [Methanolobus sp.]|nr:hypothetical protein [Methanolobus sp.]
MGINSFSKVIEKAEYRRFPVLNSISMASIGWISRNNPVPTEALKTARVLKMKIAHIGLIYPAVISTLAVAADAVDVMASLTGAGSDTASMKEYRSKLSTIDISSADTKVFADHAISFLLA